MTNETVVNAVPIADDAPKVREPLIQTSQRSVTWYSVLLASVLAGWLLRDSGLINPEEGVGYWLGIVGGSLMLLLLLYPVGKKSKILRQLGLVKHWFRIHMVFGLVGPLLILYHCNYRVDATNSKVAFYSMLAVALSGIVGKHFYARIHRGLYGKRTSIEELRRELADSASNNRGLAAILPGFTADLQQISVELLGDRYTRKISIGRALSWSVKHYWIRLLLTSGIRKELKALSETSHAIRENSEEIGAKTRAFARRQVALMRQVAQLSFYERLFSLWHILHMPLFLLLVVSGLIHVLAVHMY